MLTILVKKHFSTDTHTKLFIKSLLVETAGIMGFVLYASQLELTQQIANENNLSNLYGGQRK